MATRSRHFLSSSVRWLPVTAAFVVVALVASRAEAEEASAPAPDAALVEARDAFRLGSTLARQEQWAEALAAFGRSDRLHAHAVTTYNIGYCERSLARYTRARAAFRKALKGGGDFGELPADLALAARGYLGAIEPRLAHALITLGDANTAVAVDGRPLELEDSAGSIPEWVAGVREPGPPARTSVSTFRLLLDPGTHVFVLSRGGAAPRVLSRVFAAGESVNLSFVEPETDRRPPEPSRAAAFVAFGFGAAGLTVGAITGALALAKKDQLDEVCVTKASCPPGAQEDIDLLGGLADASTITLVIGATGAALGTVLFFTTPSPEAPAVEAGSVGAWIGPSTVGMSAAIRW